MTKRPQGELFTDVDAALHVPAVVDSDTSRAAAVAVAPLTGALRVAVLRWAQERDGFTCVEAEDALKLKHQTCSARIRELVQLGFVVDSGERRATSGKATGRIYKVTRRI